MECYMSRCRLNNVNPKLKLMKDSLDFVACINKDVKQKGAEGHHTCLRSL